MGRVDLDTYAAIDSENTRTAIPASPSQVSLAPMITAIRALMTFLGVAFGIVFFGSAAAQPLPEGNSGIAARYLGDVGIGSDPSVIFADDFESYGNATGLTIRWNEAYHAANLRIATEPGNVFRGSKALELRVPQTNNEVSNTAVKYINPTRDTLFVRYYAKYDAGFNVLGSSHNGNTIQANYCCPGVPADGTNKFLISFEAWRGEPGTANPGQLNIYIYHPEQRDIWGDHFFPSGRVLPIDSIPGDFGPNFIPRPEVTPQLGRWYGYEVMLKANTPGQRDGRIAMWLDGVLIADFLNLRLRDISTLKIDRVTIDLHVRDNNAGEAKKWYDNVVIATSYIGPLAGSDSTVPLAPTNLRFR
jgi:hypothetical protein